MVMNLSLKATLAIFLTALAVAQEENEISTKFRIVSWESGNPTDVAYFNAGEAVRVNGINNSMRSVFLDYKGPRNLLLYDVSASLDATETSKAPEPIAKIRFPPGVKYPLVILLPNPEKVPPFLSVIFDDDPSKFPFGTYFFQNFTTHKVAADMGGERFIVEPERSQHLVSSDEKALHLRLAVSEETEKGWKMVFDSFYPNWGERRTMIFIYDTVRNGRSRVETRTLIENEAVWEEAMSPSEKD